MEKKPEATWCPHIKAFGFFQGGGSRLKMECSEPIVVSWQALSWCHFECWTCYQRLLHLLKTAGSDSRPTPPRPV